MFRVEIYCGNCVFNQLKHFFFGYGSKIQNRKQLKPINYNIKMQLFITKPIKLFPFLNC